MTDAEIALALTMVKQRLNRLDAALDDYLKARIRAAYDTMTGWGIHPDLSGMGDLMFLVDLAVYQYSNRDSAVGEPRWLIKRRNDRWLMERRDQA